MRKTTIAIGSSVAIASMGICLSAAGEGERATDRTMRGQAAKAFVETDEFIGTDVLDMEGDKLGSVSDVLVDRGSGNIPYVIVDTSNMLGFGGSKVAVPYSAFGWVPDEEEPTLDTTEDELERMPTFSEDRWLAGGGDLDRRRSTDERREAESRERPDLYDEMEREAHRRHRDAYGESIRGAETVVLHGTIDSIDRERRQGEEQVVLAIRTEREGTKHVALGPSWHVLTGERALQRGDQIRITAYDTDDLDYVASSAQIDGRDVRYRDESSGRAAWQPGEGDSDGSDGSRVRQRYMLLSNLDGKDIACRGEGCGEIEDTVIECRQGCVAFLVIDPDENFLGIADDSRLVPFQALSVSTGDEVRLDASREMVLNSREAPDDLEDLDARTAEAIYEAFGMDGRSRGELSERPRR